MLLAAVVIEFIILIVGMMGLSKLTGDPESGIVRFWLIAMCVTILCTCLYGLEYHS